MKKTIALIVFLSMCIGADAHPVVKRTKSCGGLFGYSYVDTDLVPHEGSGSGYGWVIECTGRGYSSCPKKGRGEKLNTNVDATVSDIYDHAVAEDLITDVEAKIEAGSTGGSYKVTRQVEGQDFLRVYTISWTSGSASCDLDEEEAVTVMEVDVEYVQL